METPTTRPPKGYTHGAFTIQRWELVEGERVVLPVEVPGLIADCGYLGLHKPVVEGYGLWTVTHLPSGQLVTTLPTQAAGRQCITSLLAVPSLSENSPNSHARSRAQAIIAILHTSLAEAATPSPRVKSGRRRGSGLSSFSPVVGSTVPTPRTRVALNRAALALGAAFSAKPPPKGARDFAGPCFLDQMTDAASVLWREEIVVRVTQPPRAILLESDIPNFSNNQSPTSPMSSGITSPEVSKRPSSGASLRDGTPATPGEFRRRYQVLLDLGDRLRRGSLAFQTFYAEGEEEGWTVARLEKWEVMDTRFRAIVCEGWMVWSGAAFCLAVNPFFLANVEAKLGYVGNEVLGWHELGVKTLLRHPEVTEVQPLRREMREKIWREL